MFKSMTVSRFRCFADLKVEHLERINLIGGKNNIGKTALLEAIFLLLGPDNPELPMRLSALRGIPWVEAVPEETWGWLFLERRTQDTIEIAGRDESNQQRRLRIRLAEPEAAQLQPVANGKDVGAKPMGSFTTAMGPRELVLEYEEAGKGPVTSRASLVVEGDQLKLKVQRPGDRQLPLFERAPAGRFPLGVFLTSAAHHPQENAKRFSELQEVGREGEVLESLRILEPRLQRLVVSATGPGPIIQGDIGIGRHLPIQLMGEGMGKFLSCLLAVADASHGTVLIDELENGLHYTVLPKVWKAIAEFARRFETQVFATTHSGECIRAAHDFFVACGSYDFAYHRLDRAAENIACVTFDREMLSTALATGLEPR